MLLRKWRTSRGMKQKDAVKFFGLKSAGALCDLEQGHVFPSLKTAWLIAAATRGVVRWGDHFEAWGKANPEKLLALHAAAQDAAKKRSLGKTKETGHGRNGRRRGKARHR